MAGKAGVEDDIMSDINVVPLVDIVLVLLIIFMVTASFIVKPAIEMELPKADTGEHNERNQFSLILGKGGEIAIGKTTYTEDQIPGEFETRYLAYREEKRAGGEKEGRAYSDSELDRMASEELTMVIQADKDVSHGRVIHFIDLARKTGIMKYAFNVEAPKDESAAPAADGSVGESN